MVRLLLVKERVVSVQRFKNGDFDVQGHALYLVGPARRSVLRTVKTD